MGLGYFFQGGLPLGEGRFQAGIVQGGVCQVIREARLGIQNRKSGVIDRASSVNPVGCGLAPIHSGHQAHHDQQDQNGTLNQEAVQGCQAECEYRGAGCTLQNTGSCGSFGTETQALRLVEWMLRMSSNCCRSSGLGRNAVTAVPLSVSGPRWSVWPLIRMTLTSGDRYESIS